MQQRVAARALRLPHIMDQQLCSFYVAVTSNVKLLRFQNCSCFYSFPSPLYFPSSLSLPLPPFLPPPTYLIVPPPPSPSVLRKVGIASKILHKRNLCVTGSNFAVLHGERNRVLRALCSYKFSLSLNNITASAEN